MEYGIRNTVNYDYWDSNVTLSLMFLPAVLELSRPKDAGPRFINEAVSEIPSLPLVNLEADYRFAELGLPMAGNLKLFNLE